jgi:uncharacterized protein (TIGR00297 family)
MLIALPYAWASSPERLLIAIAVTIAFAALARFLHGVNSSGALAGGVCCFILFACAGPAAFAALCFLFVMTWASTRLGRARKQSLGLAERREGRNAWQVLANLAVAAGAAVLFSFRGNPVWQIAAVSALAEAATDTVASEIGQSQGATARMITTWQRVSAGTDGGITLIGTLAGAAAGLAIVVIATVGGLLPLQQSWVALTAGLAGMFFDSFLGATMQRRHWLSNQAVNFFSTLLAALIAFGATK